MPRAKKPDFEEAEPGVALKPVTLPDITRDILRLPRGEIRYIARELVYWLKTHPPGTQVSGPPLLPIPLSPAAVKEELADGPPVRSDEVPVVRKGVDAGDAVPGDGCGVPDGVLGVWDVPGDAAEGG